MATLVFTAVGTALGGPLGGAIGSLLGHSVDQQLFGSSRRGPRLGDLAVQTSTYGTQIPRVYGTMRVAGSVIWATDLQESSATTGAKGQPDTTVYSYSVSMAVALSSRRAGTVKRIWADGKLLRGAEGDFKVSTEYRFYDGDENQAIDPLIGSIEGIAQTPAYRGLAIAVFENLELAEYGNRIPFLTFEVEADSSPPSIGAILADASGQRVECSAAATVAGYAAHGASMQAALEPLIERYGLELVDDGITLRSPPAALPLRVAESELGCAADGAQPPRLERSQLAARSLPSTLTLAYYDASRDFQTSQMRGSIGENSGRQEDAELPAVLDAAGAKSLVEAELARRWAERDRLSVRLPPALMGLMPGSILEIPGVAGRWAVQQSTIDGLSVAAELRPATGLLEALDGDAGRAALSADVPTAEARLALFEVRDSEEDQPDGATLYLAASSAEGRWKAASVELTVGGLTQTIRTSARKSVLGVTLSILSAEAEVLDVELFDREQWLESYEDSAIEHGANLAFVGDELIQFGNAEPTGPGRFRLSKLLRGCRGTGWAMLDHDSGEPFAMFDPSALQRLDLPPSMHGLSISATARGLAGTNSPTISKRTGRGRIGSDARLGPSQRRE